MTSWKQKLDFSAPLRDAIPAGGRTAEQQEELVRRREEASYQRGRADGERALSEQLMQQRAEVLELQKGVLASLAAAMPQVKEECEQALTTLAIEVAAKLVAGLPISAPMIEAAIKEALAQVEEQTDYHIYLQPDDLELLQQINSPLLLPHVTGQKIHLHRAPELSRGGCIVRTRFGLTDATRETKLEMLQQALA